MDGIQQALASHYFAENYVTAVGKTEWADIKWNDQSIAEKKTIINGADLVFISANTATEWANAKSSLETAGVNSRLLDCSDAHWLSSSTNKDRIGNCLTWIKADSTFEGLKQVLNEPQERISVEPIPDQLARLRDNPTKYIRSIRIDRKPSASIGEKWFDVDIPFNPGLVAIIGNKGKGKSALTDTIGLLTNTRQDHDFTFLSPENFRQPRDNKARHFKATLTWESGTQTTKGLDDLVDAQQPELVKYIPQNFLEKICTQLGKIDESDFDRELKKVIFSHIGTADRLGTSSFGDLLSLKTSEADDRIEILKRELHRINQKIVALEERALPETKRGIENSLALKKMELTAHDQLKPSVVEKPESQPGQQAALAEVEASLKTAKDELKEIETRVAGAQAESAKLAQQIATVDRVIGRVDNFNRQLATFRSDIDADLATIDIRFEEFLKITVDKTPLTTYRAGREEAKDALSIQLISFETKKKELESKIGGLQSQLDEPSKRFHAYEASLATWKQKRESIEGGKDATGSLKYFETQLESLKAVPTHLADALARRLAKTLEVYAILTQLASTYRELYTGLQAFVGSNALAKDRFQLNFDVGIVDTGFAREFFDVVSHGVAGTFCGVEEGRKELGKLLDRHDFNKEDGIKDFLQEIMDSLENDKRPEGKKVNVPELIRRGKSTLDLYNLIFSLDYLKPRYALRMGDKELHQLSPGERGTLLLVFYLLADKSDVPLVIDQPEENLDNQTVYELLVPCMKDARRRRQVIVVTHNPNLAVVCDAEQIIWADLDKKANYLMRYTSGAIENPIINKAIIDILEGTIPAFDNRDAKYAR